LKNQREGSFMGEKVIYFFNKNLKKEKHGKKSAPDHQLF